jgi:hypothetical protein
MDMIKTLAGLHWASVALGLTLPMVGLLVWRLAANLRRRREGLPTPGGPGPSLADEGNEDTLPSVRSPLRGADPIDTATTDKHPALRGKRPLD